MRKRLFAISLGFFVILACAAPNQSDKSAPPHGFGKAMLGVAQLVLSPLQIAAGLLEGIASVPYYLSMSLQDINQGMVAADAKVTLDDTYESAYGKRIKAVSPDGDTGEVFRRMKHATEYFQKVLRRYGLADADHYILTSIDNATGKGYTLFAVVYRPQDTIRVVDKYDGTSLRTFTREDRLFYEPFSRDADGKNLDTIVDWSGLSREFINTQKGQALMLTMAANAVIDEKRSPDYWAVEKQWLAGEYESIVQHKMNAVRNKMKIDN